MSTRPRRTIRSAASSKTPQFVAAASKISHDGPNLQFLLKNPRSALTKLDISTIFNAETWSLLSEDSRAVLSTLLPPTAFFGYQQSIDTSHPSQATSSPSSSSSGTLDPSVFTDAHFLSAAHTFQDHIFSGWTSDSHTAKVEKSKQGIRDGTLSAPYKDDEWDNQNRNDAQWLTLPESSARAGYGPSYLHTIIGQVSYFHRQAAEVKFTDLVHNAIIQVGDLISYKRNFTNGNIVIEKDALVQSIDRRTKNVTLLLPSGTTQHLPAVLLARAPVNPDDSIRSMTIMSPSMLETGLLDIDGRVERGKRPNGNAWKSFTLWRWKDSNEELFGLDERGGRESHGTLFYIRGCFYHDR
ncbi:Asx homology domain-containing protein [Armillaria mellea]|nr:Asx homology domain-containing protein [Armillaria mellea]